MIAGAGERVPVVRNVCRKLQLSARSSRMTRIIYARDGRNATFAFELADETLIYSQIHADDAFSPAAARNLPYAASTTSKAC